LGIGHVDMTEISGQNGQEPLGILLGFVPTHQRVRREHMPHVMQARAVAVSCSAEQLFGYSAEEAIGQPGTLLIPPERLDEDYAILRRAERGDRVDNFETVRRRKDGSLINVSLTISPIKGAEGKVVGAVKIARDITQRKRTEAQVVILAREAEHRAKNLLANLRAMVRLS
jgi:PAS domain S-box-containing protein